MDTLVSTDWLSQQLGDPDLVVLDCMVITDVTETDMKNRSGIDSYNEGHIPTAGFADLMGDLCDNSASVEFALPSPEAFCAAMGKLGIEDDSRVVLYDASISAWAARVWWMLRWVGFDRAAILDGGLNAWKAEGRPMSTEPALHKTRQLTARPRPGVIADRDEVSAAINDPSVQLIDTLPPESFRGEMPLYGRSGHIPSAINIGGMDLLDENGLYRSKPELDTMHDFDKGKRAITYCGGGILASSNAFVMTRLGFKDVAVYTASLQEWAADDANPMTTVIPHSES